MSTRSNSATMMIDNSSSLTLPLAPQKRKMNDLSDFTIDKLNYSSLGLKGRDKEVEQLNHALQKLIQDESASASTSGDGKIEQHQQQRHHQRQMVLISGYSGTGKTALVTHALQIPTETVGGLFVRGKFDDDSSSSEGNKQPYLGITILCEEICSKILQLQFTYPNLFQTIRTQLRTELGGSKQQLSLLIQLIPNLTDVLEQEEDDDIDINLIDDDDDKSSSSRDSEESLSQGGQRGGRNITLPHRVSMSSSSSSYHSKNQFNFAVLKFIHIIATQFIPLILVFDDLQWADAPSLDLINVLLTTTDPSSSSSKTSSKVMIIGIYQSNDEVVDKTHILYRTKEELQHKSQEKDNNFEMIQLEIRNLEFDAVHKIIQELLGMDDDDDDDNCRTLELAKICYTKTNGNVFFLLQYVSMLKQHDMLQFNHGTLSWTWDCSEIEARTSSSDNTVVSLLKDKMFELSKITIEILKIASCLGSTFEMRILRTIWETSTGLIDEADDTLVSSLETLITEGYIIKNRSQSSHSSCYSWCHDKIQEAALQLIPELEQGTFAANIGQILLSHLDEDDLDSTIFVVVNLLNRGDDKKVLNKDDDEQQLLLDCARLNYKASRKAIDLSAFESAAAYAAKGIEFLSTYQNVWVDHYELALAIYTIGAQAEGFLGNTDTMDRYCQQVLLQEDRPIEDKFDIYKTWIDSLMNRGLLEEAMELLLDILKTFKCTFPKNSTLVRLAVVKNIVKIKSTSKSRDFSKLPLLTDTKTIGLMKLLDKLGNLFYLSKDDRAPLVLFRSLNWTMKYGYCEYSSAAIAATGRHLTGVLNDLQGGSNYGEQALSLMERCESQNTAARTMFIVYTAIFPWTKPARSLLTLCLHGYDSGLQTGDTESATWSIFHWLCIKYFIGSSLEALEVDSLLYIKRMKGLKRDVAVVYTNILRQAILNLLGTDNVDNPTNFSGTALSEEELKRSREDPMLGPQICTYHGILLTYFGEHEQYAGLVLKLGHDYYQKASIANPSNMWDTLLKGISCFVAAGTTGKKKYAKMGQIFRSKIKKWIDMGNPNINQYESLLDAEWMAYKGNNVAAIKLYESAIVVSTRGGYQHDAALATERLGEFHLTVMDNREEAGYQIGKSIKYWGEWGAMAKVRHLREKYAELM